jgi:RNA 3'-terminal phosphate cyclase (ATP)
MTMNAGREIIEIDGAMGEGGGQILRTSLAMSLITGQGFHLRRVRANRDRPGLRPQHLTCVRAAARIGDAKIQGAAEGSRELWFEPRELRPGHDEFSIPTAGALSLVLHTVYLPLALRSSEVCDLVLEGGTHVNASPCFHFLETTWRRYLEEIGIRVALRLERSGFYPRGGGRIHVRIKPCNEPRTLQIVQTQPVNRITIQSAVAGLPVSIAARQDRQASERLRPSGLPLESRVEEWPGGPGTMLALILHGPVVPIMFFALGARGKPAERVADEAVDEALAYLNSPGGVDPHSADQLLLPLVLAPGHSCYPVSAITSHLLTNALVIGQFINRQIRVAGALREPGTVAID